MFFIQCCPVVVFFFLALAGRKLRRQIRESRQRADVFLHRARDRIHTLIIIIHWNVT